MNTTQLSDTVIFNNNILIGKFMGFVDKTTESDPHYLGQDGEVVYEFMYHEDWNDLMKAVDKIEKMGFNFSTRFNHDTNSGALHWAFFSERDESGQYPHNPYGKKIVMEKGSGNGVYSSNNSKIEAIFQAVVGFINYYNEKTK